MNSNSGFYANDMRVEKLDLRNYGKIIPIDQRFMLAIPGTKGKGLLDPFDHVKENINNCSIQMIDLVDKKVFYNMEMQTKNKLGSHMKHPACVLVDKSMLFIIGGQKKGEW